MLDDRRLEIGLASPRFFRSRCGWQPAQQEREEGGSDEINSLPALTPSTVLFQQALAQETPVYPMEFLELIADNK